MWGDFTRKEQKEFGGPLMDDDRIVKRMVKQLDLLPKSLVATREWAEQVKAGKEPEVKTIEDLVTAANATTEAKHSCSVEELTACDLLFSLNLYLGRSKTGLDKR